MNIPQFIYSPAHGHLGLCPFNSIYFGILILELLFEIFLFIFSWSLYFLKFRFFFYVLVIFMYLFYILLDFSVIFYPEFFGL